MTNMFDFRKQDEFTGSGWYVAFNGWFACRDDHGETWRLSRITQLENKVMQLTYEGEFDTETDIRQYIRQNS